MGLFDRKRVRKAAPEQVKPLPGNNPIPQTPYSQPPSRYATSTTQTPSYWQPPQHQQQHQPQQQPPYHNQHPIQPQQAWPQAPQRSGYPQPIVVNQHYHLHPPPSTHNLISNNSPYSHTTTAVAASQTSPLGLDKLAAPVVTFAKDFSSPQFFDEPNFHPHATQLINSTAACVDQIAGCFNDVMTLIDRDRMAGHEKALFTYQPTGDPAPRPREGVGKRGGGGGSGGKSSSSKKRSKESSAKGQSTVTASVVSGSYFAKVQLYANSRLPLNLPPLRLYMPTWPLLCMAAQYAERVYDQPKGAERDTHVPSDWKTGTKAMVIKSVPMDHMNTIVFAIRGSATFMDWAVNLNTAPASPAGFLDDPGNSCHAGFLAVARKMVRPVAARLRQLLEEDPGRSAYSLLITGHSAGGAVAALLYSHMLATTPGARSELNTLTGCFKRVHCVTFGTPPVSLLPLQKEPRAELRKSLFLTFVNEGDPITRADVAYVKSLLELYATPAPSVAAPERKGRLAGKESRVSLRGRGRDGAAAVHVPREELEERARRPVWEVPPSTLSSPGRIVVLRSGDPRAAVKDRKTVEERLNEGVVAQTVTDGDLRGVIWGDPVCHVMRLYSGRIETLAVGAVTGKHG
ncbi:Phospholipase A(1) DAD1, chloroplastic [Colletotrichum chlorophyti]|uniref:Phospholipase A(1) DAD1, chloroplastic n=1 Tax=Colletotrichum chlorophyti TaxID=708187 RepID=A0A1Q8S5M6_9PEZI|nr:Phospholipase A(1) DAD1, chloroplastic [Colletotrichum chlorophyti]